MAINRAFVDEVVDDGWDVAFAFELPALFVEEEGKVSLDLVDKTEREGPEVHGDDDVFFDEAGAAIEGAAFDLFFTFAGDVDHFLNSLKESVGGLADAAVDGTVIGKGADEVVADEGVVSLAVVRVSRGEKTGGLLVGVGAIEVIGIDNGKRAVEFVPGSPDGVGGAPGFFASSGKVVSFGEVVEALKGIGDLDKIGEFIADVLLKVCGEVLTDDEDDL